MKMKRAPAIFLLACLAMWLLLVAVLVASSITATSVWWPRALLWAALICALVMAVTFVFGKKHPQLVDRLILLPAFIYLLGFPLLAALVLIMEGDEYVSLVIYQEGIAAFFVPPLAVLVAVPAFVRNRSLAWRMGALLMAISFVVLGEADFGKGLFGDVFTPRQHVVGTVSEMERGHQYRWTRGGWRAARVKINDQWYSVTRDLEPRFHVGALVDAEAGAGSKFLLKVFDVVP
jgi:hypothetical protein